MAAHTIPPLFIAVPATTANFGVTSAMVMPDWAWVAAAAGIVAAPFAVTLLVDLLRLIASAVARYLRWRGLLPASPLPRDSVLVGVERGSEAEEWLAALAQEECRRKLKLHPRQLPRRSLDAVRSLAVRAMRSPEHRSRFEAHFQRPAWEMLQAGDPEIEDRIRRASGEMRRRPLFVTGRLIYLITFKRGGMSAATSWMSLDVERLRRDFGYFRRESMVCIVSQLGWLDQKIQRWRLGQGAIGLLQRPAESTRALTTERDPSFRPRIVSRTPAEDDSNETPPAETGPDLIVQALELLDDGTFWVSPDADERARSVLTAVREAGRGYRDPAMAARAAGAIEQRLIDLRAFGEWLERHMAAEETGQWPRALNLALADCGEPLTEQEFELRARQRFLLGPTQDREPAPPIETLHDEPRNDSGEAEKSERDEVQVIPASDPRLNADFRRAEVLF